MRMYRKDYGVEVEEVTIEELKEEATDLYKLNKCPSSIGLEESCFDDCDECRLFSISCLAGKWYKMTYDNDDIEFISQDDLNLKFETRL